MGKKIVMSNYINNSNRVADASLSHFTITYLVNNAALQSHILLHQSELNSCYFSPVSALK